MESLDKSISSSRVNYHNPSFSSTLLDQIYRSIDDSPAVDSTRKKNHHHRNDRELSPNKFFFHRRSTAAALQRSRTTTTIDSVFLRYYNSSSSDSSGFSSSESDSFHGLSKSSASPPMTRQPKPIRTFIERFDHSGVQKPNSKQELGGFLRTKSKALKIYTDLKKVKHPISPGGRLATFLNSLFTNAASNPKKPKKISTAASEPQSTMSFSSSSSRSCLSKTPSSSGKSKRSVRFCPVNVILDEDSSIHIPYGYGNNDCHVMKEEEEENRRVIEAAKDLLRTYQKKSKDHSAVTTATKFDDVINLSEEVDDDDDDDAASYASSDLFELENLSAIGIERYREELPVYETTCLDNTNRAVATSLVL